MILFRPEQIRIKSSHSYGKWYARMVSTNTVTTEDLAHELSHGSSVTEADILAVLYGVEDIIRRHLNNSETVKLDRLGTFRVSLRSHVVDSPKDVNKKLVFGYKVAFQPIMKFHQTGVGESGGHTGYYSRELIKGADVKAIS